VVLCSGKVYFDLLAERRKREISDIAIVRIEQLYPFPRHPLREILDNYTGADEVVWCQEEPRNQGAWYQVRHHLRAIKHGDQSLGYAGRPPSASPACGYLQLHLAQQQALIETALSENPVDDPGDRLEDTDTHYPV
jgi:2-oxoglutarate dehydrogenase E1 component